MPVARDAILSALSDLLHVDAFQDYGPQGLQVEGAPSVGLVVTGVSSCVALFEAGAALGADMVLVHHGLLWDNESHVVRGGLRQRLRLLLDHDITLAAYHLCLDAHPEIGNNALAARALGLDDITPWSEHRGQPIGCAGRWSGLSLPEAKARVAAVYGAEGLVFPYGPDRIERVGVVSGGAQGDVRRAILDGMDMFITGEASEFVMHAAREGGIHFVAAGHHNTERLGIRALGDWVAAEFGVRHEFVDVPNPV